MAETHRNGALCDYRLRSKCEHSLTTTHRLKLEQAAAGYKMFDKKEEDCRKVVLTL